MKRRTFLAGATALAASSFIPAMPAIASYPKDYDKIMAIFTNTYKRYDGDVILFNGFPVGIQNLQDALSLVEIMVRKGHIDLSHTMTLPVEYVRVGDNYHITTAQSRNYKAEITMGAFPPDFPSNDMFETIANELIHENDDYIKMINSINKKTIELYHYMPVIPVRAIDPNTFQPKICFKSRRGTQVPGHTETMDEERRRRMSLINPNQYYHRIIS